jgi:hypothetical protein
MGRMDVPDWLWQELAADAIWTSIGLGAAWAWKQRKEIAGKLRFSNLKLGRQVISPYGAPSTERAGTPTLTASAAADLRWKVEAPTPSLAKRLTDEGIELASWYMRHA